MKFLQKPYAYASLFGLLLTGGFTYSLLKTFVISQAITAVAADQAATESRASQTQTTASQETTASTDTSASTATGSAAEPQAQAVITDQSYSDDQLDIQLSQVRYEDTTVYIAEVNTTDSSLLKTALAQETFGTNITAKTSTTAASKGAILAINGDYYGANTSGYVIKNGTIYRDTVRNNADQGDLAIYADGSFKIINEKEVTAQELVEQGVVNLLAFGPALVQDGQITVSETQEVGRAMASNPRTAIGLIGDNHYLIMVADGRTDESEGLSLYQLADLMQSYGATTAYNLDGGGSSTLYFNGQIINQPTTNGRTISERAVSDIVYFGY